MTSRTPRTADLRTTDLAVRINAHVYGRFIA